MSEKELMDEAVEAFLGDREVLLSESLLGCKTCECCCADIKQSGIEDASFDVVYRKDLDYIGTVCSECAEAINRLQEGE